MFKRIIKLQLSLQPTSNNVLLKCASVWKNGSSQASPLQSSLPLQSLLVIVSESGCTYGFYTVAVWKSPADYFTSEVSTGLCCVDGIESLKEANQSRFEPEPEPIYIFRS